MLPHSVVGSGEPSIVFVHGFTQTRTSWRPCAERLAARHRCYLVDAPHHGEARSLDVDYADAARAVGDSSRECVLVGYSMGGRLALSAAVAPSTTLRALVLVSTTAGIEDDTERAARRADDDALAHHIESIGTDLFISEWLSQPLFAGSRRNEAELTSRRTNSAESLARSLRQCGAGEQAPVWNDLHKVVVPTLIVAGARDSKYVGLARRLHDSIAGSELSIIDDAGHAVHLDQPDRFADALEDFLVRRVDA